MARKSRSPRPQARWAIGLEDSPFVSRGVLAQSDAQQIAEDLGSEDVNSDEAPGDAKIGNLDDDQSIACPVASQSLRN